jgi:hypothetical protein
VVFAAASATVAGVVPAIRLTGKKVQENIQRAEAGRSGIKFGGITSTLIVADVAVAVAVVGLAVGMIEQISRVSADEALTGIPAEEYLAVELRLPVDQLGEDGSVDMVRFGERLASTHQAVVDRLRAEPGVRGVVVADALPRMDHRSRLIEAEGFDFPGTSGRGRVRTAMVGVDYFEELDQPIVAGRPFDRADLAAEVPPAIVNTVFVDRLLGGRDPVGRRVRFVVSGGDPDPGWHEIVGVVGHLGVNILNPGGDVGMYVLTPPGGIYPLQVGIHLGASPESFAPRLRDIVAEVDPNALMATPVVLSSVHQGDWYLVIVVAVGLVVFVTILVVLAASGVYAIMSFAVSERTREIGIRTALGARRSSIVATILRRSLTQIGVGALLGIALAWRVLGEVRNPTGQPDYNGPALVVAVGLGVAIVTLIGLFSLVAPTRRALRIQPSEALRGAD